MAKKQREHLSIITTYLCGIVHICSASSSFILSPANLTAIFQCQTWDIVPIFWLINDESPTLAGVPYTTQTQISTLSIPDSCAPGAWIVCYYVLQSSAMNVYSSVAFFTVIGPSSSPILTTISMNHTTSNIAWTIVPVIHTPMALYFIVLILNRHGIVVSNMSAPDLFLRFNILDPCDLYNVTVSAVYHFPRTTCIKTSSATWSGDWIATLVVIGLILAISVVLFCAYILKKMKHAMKSISQHHLDTFNTTESQCQSIKKRQDQTHCAEEVTVINESHLQNHSKLEVQHETDYIQVVTMTDGSHVQNQSTLEVYAVIPPLKQKGLASIPSLQPTVRSYLLIFYDMATTGFSTSTDHVIEIGAAVSSTHCKMASPKFSQLVNTDHPITKEASEVTGISYEMLKQKEPFKVVFTHFLMWIDTTVAEVFKTTGVAHIPVLVAHNGFCFDFRILFAELQRHKMSCDIIQQIHFADTLHLLRQAKKSNNYPNLPKSLAMENLVKEIDPTYCYEKRAHSSVTAMDELFRLPPYSRILQEIKNGCTALMLASRYGLSEFVKELLKMDVQVNAQQEDGDTALHIAAVRSHEDCVRLLLSTIGIDANLVNHTGKTPLKLATSYEVLTLLKKYTTSCEDFPVHTYGKVIMCGDSGAGKTTLTEAIIHHSESISEDGVDQQQARRTERKPVKTLTAGIVPHHVQSPGANMTIYDLAGHREYYSSHSSILELISKTTPSVFLLLVNLLLSLEDIIAQIYYWSSLIGNVCHMCPQLSSIIVVGTHADCIVDSKKLEYLHIHIEQAAKNAIKHQIFVQFTALNVTAFSKDLDTFISLLYHIIDDIRMKCPAISLSCHVMYAFLKDKVPEDQEAISMSQLLILLNQENPKVLPTDAAGVSELLKTLSEKGFIVFFDTNLADSWIVLRQDTLLEKVNGVLFAPAHFKEHIPIASNTGVIPISVLKCHFPQYNIDMITQFLIRFELCQPITLAATNTTLQRPSICSCPDLFIPALVSANRPDDVTIPNDAFGWKLCTISINQSFSPRFLHVLVSRIADEFPLQSLDTCLNPYLQRYNRSCTVWKRGISWRSEEGFTTVIEMSADFRCLQCAVSTYDKTDNTYSKLVLSVINIIMEACNDFCPSVSRVELITCPPEATSDQVAATVECEALKKILLKGTAKVIDSTRKKVVSVSRWRELEPQLPTLLGVKLKQDDIRASLTADDHTKIYQTTKSASRQWRAIGGVLGFTIDELDSIVREPGRHGDEDYYAAMLRRWLDWAPPNHTPPCLQSLQSALRAEGKEMQANSLEAKYTK